MKHLFRRQRLAVLSVLLGMLCATAVSVYAGTTIGTDISTGGSLSVTGHSAFGATATIDQAFPSVDAIDPVPTSDTEILNLRETNTNISNDYHAGLFVGEILKPSGPLNGNHHGETGIESQLSTDATDAQNHGDLYGIESWVTSRGTGNIDNIYAVSSGRSILSASANLGTSYGLDVFLEPVAGTIGTNYGIQIETPNVTTGSIGTNYGLSIQDQSVGTNNYAIWYNGPGNVVWRVKADGVVADYNPSFSPKYTPGATDFERVITQWNSNVAEIGTQAGGTGTQRPLRLLGSSVLIPGNVGIGTTTPSTPLVVTAGGNATTTVTVGELGLTTSKTCINMNRANGQPGSMYLSAAGVLIVENNYCH